MITISKTYLDAHWRQLVEETVLPVPFSEWDDGDAYTLDGMGAAAVSRKITYAGAIVGEGDVTAFPLLLRFVKTTQDGTPSSYHCPDGTLYNILGFRVLDGVPVPVAVRVEDLQTAISARRRGLIETELLKDATVLIIGLGTGGVSIALELAKSGVGNFLLVDPDRLEVGNITRHSAGISFVGRKKVNASRDLIHDKNPFASVTVFDVEANEQHHELITGLIRRSDIVICATDGRQSKLFVNKLCVTEKRSCVYGGAFRRAYGGQVLRVRPGESACYHCFVLSMPEKEADHEVSSASNADEIQYSDRPVAVEPGLSMDVAPISLMVAKLCLQELLRGKPSTLHILDRDFTAGWYFWVNRPEPGTDYADLPPLSESSDEITIMRWYGVHLEKDPGCPSCGDFAKVLRESYGIEAGTGTIPIRPVEGNL